MESLVLLVCSALLLATASNGQTTLNCNLQNGAGCDVSGPDFYMDYKFTHSGSSSQCRQAYDLTFRLPSGADGVECSFVTDGSPQRNTYRYTISHNDRTYWDRNTPYIRVYGNDARFKMADGSGIYNDNWWYHPNMHASSGYSWANYKITTRHLSYYSSNTGIQHQSGHPNGFTPRTRTTYIGLNKRFDSNSFGGYGLCQVYCTFVYPSSGRSSSPAATGESLSAPVTPRRPPPPPTGSGK